VTPQFGASLQSSYDDRNSFIIQATDYCTRGGKGALQSALRLKYLLFYVEIPFTNNVVIFLSQIIWFALKLLNLMVPIVMDEKNFQNNSLLLK
jgi:hypothetical protein